ncbi:MAG: hypothetical protein JNK56_22380 [Myxococcales bacterium]|nr:hypothetical protein [Myxococcales bacterium]
MLDSLPPSVVATVDPPVVVTSPLLGPELELDASVLVGVAVVPVVAAAPVLPVPPDEASPVSDPDPPHASTNSPLKIPTIRIPCD